MTEAEEQSEGGITIHVVITPRGECMGAACAGTLPETGVDVTGAVVLGMVLVFAGAAALLRAAAARRSLR